MNASLTVKVEDFHFSGPQSRRYRSLYTVKRNTTFVNSACSLSEETPKLIIPLQVQHAGPDMYLDAVVLMKIQGLCLMETLAKNVAAKGRMTITVEKHSIIIVHGKARSPFLAAS